MRRKDREMSKEFGLELVDKATFGTLSITDNEGKPLALPLSFGRRGDTIYFHSAKFGEKNENIRDGAPVTVVFVGDHQVPSIMTRQEAEEIMKDPQSLRKLTRKVFTTEYESAIVRGAIRSVTDPAEKMDALRAVCEKYTPDWMDYFDAAANSAKEITAVYAISIEEITAKRNKVEPDAA